jgi:hypothetical protein
MRTFHPPDPLSVRVSVALYRLLLFAYPSEFRREYAQAMIQIFRDCCLRDTRRAGLYGLLGLWLRTTLDYLVTVIGEHLQKGTLMSKSLLSKLGGWGFMIGSILFVSGWVASSRPVYNIYNSASLPIDRLLNQAATPLMAMGSLLLTFGFVGLHARYAQAAGSFAAGSLWVGVLGGLMTTVGVIGLGIADQSPWWESFIIGMVVVSLSLVSFGAACLRKRLLLRWNPLPLAAGLIIPIVMVISLIYEAMMSRTLDMGNFWGPLILFLPYLGMGLIGFELQSKGAEMRIASSPA